MRCPLRLLIDPVDRDRPRLDKLLPFLDADLVSAVRRPAF